MKAKLLGLKWACNRYAEKAFLAIVWHLPSKLVYWCAIRVLSHATVGAYGSTAVSELTAMEALSRWRKA